MSEKPPPAAAPASRAETVAGNDVVVITGDAPDGQGLGVVRLREGRAEVGAVRPLEHGKPILGEVVTLHPRREQPRICDVEVQLPARDAERGRTHAGPPQVATDRYRENWERIFSRDKAN